MEIFIKRVSFGVDPSYNKNTSLNNSNMDEACDVYSNHAPDFIQLLNTPRRTK